MQPMQYYLIPVLGGLGSKGGVNTFFFCIGKEQTTYSMTHWRSHTVCSWQGKLLRYDKFLTQDEQRDRIEEDLIAMTVLKVSPHCLGRVGQ